MTLISILLKASVVLSAALIAHALAGRRTSAATRHLMWTFAIAGLLLLPILSAVLPGWTALRLTAPGMDAAPLVAPAAPAAAVAAARDAVPAFEPSNPGTPEPRNPGTVEPWNPGTSEPRNPGTPRWPTALLALYAAGVILLLARVAAEQVAIRRLARRATAVSDPEWRRLFLECAQRIGVRRPVRFLRSREQTMPMAFGIRRCAIVIPAVADTWPEDRRRAVLLHELAHVSRHDCLTQMMAAVACAFYWVHPGVWWVARRLRVERELACDDRVIAAGTHAREYAGHLLELAYSLGGHRAPALAVSMLRPTELEGRMLALLDAARIRTAPALRSRLAGLAIMGALLVPVAGATTSFLPATADEDALPAAPTDRAPESTQPAPSAADQDSRPGTWEIRPAREAGRVHIRLTDDDGSHGSTIDVKGLEGIVPAELLAAGGPVQFTVRRDAGAFTFEGIVRNRVGAGTFTFALNPAFASELVKRGFERPTPRDQRLLAGADVGFAFLDELGAQGYTKPSLAQLVRGAQHGISLTYLREMGQLGYRLGRIDALVEQRSHGVSPEFIRGLAAEKLPRLSPEDLIRARSHGVGPEYIRDLRAVGHGSLDLDRLIRLRSHGVSPEFIRDLENVGLGTLSLEALVDARSHGMSPDYVRELRDLGYVLTLAQLKQARSHGIAGDYVKEISALGYQRLPLDALIRLRSHGVDPEYVRALNGLGYARLDIEDLIGLRSHGVTPDRVRDANARAGTRLSVQQLKAAASRGWR
jgi:beta-lactamase regulating signal transducer with metallopeptidase domain